MTITPLGAEEESESLEPDSLSAISFEIENQGTLPARVVWEVEAPAAWTLLNGRTGLLDLLVNETRWLVVYCILPAGASPGKGEVVLLLRSEDGQAELARARRTYSVPAVGRLNFRSESVGGNGFAWDTYHERTWLQNDTNVPVRVDLDAESSQGWDLLVQPHSLELEPGAGSWVTIEVSPPRLRSAEMGHTVTITATSPDLPVGGTRALTRVTSTVLSDEAALGGPILGGRLEIESLARGQGDVGVGVNLSLSGPLDRHHSVDLRIGESLPVGTSGTVGRRASYLELSDDRWGGFLVGRTARSFSRLTAYPQWGEWGAAHFDLGPVRTELFASLSEPDTVVGRIRGLSIQVGERKGTRRQEGFGLLAFSGGRAPSEPDKSFDLVSLWTARQLGSSWFEGEIAVGRLEESDRLEPGARAAVFGAKGRWDWIGELRSSSASFPGAFWNADELWGSTGYRITPEVRIWGGGRWQSARDPNVLPAVDATTYEAGVTWRALPQIGLSLSRSTRSFDATASESDGGTEDLTRLRIDYTVESRLQAIVEVDQGERREGERSESVLRVGYTVQYRPSDQWKLRARYQPPIEEQEIFDYRQRWSLLARWQPSSESWIDIEGQKVDCGTLAEGGCRSEPATRISVGRYLSGPLRDWYLLGYAQGQQRRDPTVGIRVGRDLRLRSPFGGGRSPVQGRVVVPEGSALPVGSVVYLGDKAARIDDAGHFRIPRIEPGRHMLRVDSAALGVELVAAPPHPVPVFPEGRGPSPVTLRLERPAKVVGAVMLETGNSASAGSGQPSPQGASRPLGSLGVRLQHEQWPELVVIAVTGADGSFVASGLLPGVWSLTVQEPDLGRCAERVGFEQEMQIRVGAGETARLEPLRFRPCVTPTSLMKAPTLKLDGSR